jgi:hypothetical protein
MTQTEIGIAFYVILGVVMLAIIIRGLIKDFRNQRY